MTIHDAITNSERSTSGCIHRWWLTYGLGLAKSEESRALRLGSFWHELMEHYWVCPERGIRRLNAMLDWVAMEEKKATEASFLMFDGYDPVDTDLYDDIRSLLSRYHRRWEHDDLDVIATEQSLSMPMMGLAPGRRRRHHPASTAGRYNQRVPCAVAGKVDKLVRGDDGTVWVFEHKTTSLALDDWIRKHEYRPQGMTYLMLARDQGHDVGGIIYDLASSRMPRYVFEKIKDGSRLRKPSGLPMTTEHLWRKAIDAHGFSMGDCDWYQDVTDGLASRERQGFWFRRFSVRVTSSDIDRAQEEWRRVAASLTLLREQSKPDRDRLMSCGDDLPGGIVQVLESSGHGFPRNPSLCHEWGRCKYMDLCREQSHEAAQEMRLRSATHEEL